MVSFTLIVPVLVTVSVLPSRLPLPVTEPSSVCDIIEYVGVPAFSSIVKYCDTSMSEPLKLILESVPVIVTVVAALFLIFTVPEVLQLLSTS